MNDQKTRNETSGNGRRFGVPFRIKDVINQMIRSSLESNGTPVGIRVLVPPINQKLKEAGFRWGLSSGQIVFYLRILEHRGEIVAVNGQSWSGGKVYSLNDVRTRSRNNKDLGSY